MEIEDDCIERSPRQRADGLSQGGDLANCKHMGRLCEAFGSQICIARIVLNEQDLMPQCNMLLKHSVPLSLSGRPKNAESWQVRVFEDWDDQQRASSAR